MAFYHPTHIFSKTLQLCAAVSSIGGLYQGSNHHIYVYNMDDNVPFVECLCDCLRKTSTITEIGIDCSSVPAGVVSRLFQTLQTNTSIRSIFMYPYDAFHNATGVPERFFSGEIETALISALRLNSSRSDIPPSTWDPALVPIVERVPLYPPPSMLEFILTLEYDEITSKKNKNVS
ncbi:MAG: hypothetical protein ACOVQN_09375 [Exiguobacterium sp.]